MNRDLNIDKTKYFERSSEILALLGISVRDVNGNFRKVSEVINDLLTVRHSSLLSSHIFKDELLVAKAYDLITSEWDCGSWDDITNHREYIYPDDYLDMLRHTGLDKPEFGLPFSKEPNLNDTKRDVMNVAAQDVINDFLAEFKIIERKDG